MRTRELVFWAAGLLPTIWAVSAVSNNTSPALAQAPFYSLLDDRPDGCPPCPRCFDCHYSEFECLQFSECGNDDGRCICPPGFGSEDCGDPLCGSPAQGKNRKPRTGDDPCECDEGWGGITCNVCQTNQACSALMPGKEGGVCYTDGRLVHENFQMCDITNQPILDQIYPRIPQATFSCNADDKTCNFQFWVDQKESFYCGLDECSWKLTDTDTRNVTHYRCEKMKCACIKDRFLCGEAGSVDIGEFLTEMIKGPADFTTQSTIGGSSKDGSRFEEPAMNDLIAQIFGDEYIALACHSGECLYYTDVPGWTQPVAEINTPLVAGIIAGCALLVLAGALIAWYLARRAAYKKWGAIRLGEDDNDPTRLMSNHKPSTLR